VDLDAKVDFDSAAVFTLRMEPRKDPITRSWVMGPNPTGGVRGDQLPVLSGGGESATGGGGATQRGGMVGKSKDETQRG
jgi:hypothetical protein